MVEGCSAAATNNLGYWLSPWAAREPDRLGIIDLHGGAERRFSYGELERPLDQVAAVVRGAGVGTGERVILSLGNRAEFMLAMYGVMRAGAVPVPLNTRQGRDVLDYSIGDCEPVAAIVEPAANKQVADLCAGRLMRLRLMLDGAARGWEDYVAAVGAAEPLRETVSLPPDAVCFFSYASGSTGKPKGVPLTHAGQIWWLECLARYWRQSPDARSLVAMPLYHKNAMAGAGKPRLFTGASMVVMPGFEPRGCTIRGFPAPNSIMPTLPARRIPNRPNTIARPSAVLYQSVLTVMPANAEPLLLAAEVNAYSTSDNPCGPLLSMPAR